MSIKRLYNSDESIFEGIRASEDGALNHLYKVGYPIVRNLVLKNSGRLEDVDDILQEGIIVFYEKIRSADFKITCSITTFIYSVCRNQWLKALKKKSLNIAFSDTHETFEIDDNELDNEAVLNERQHSLKEALNKLGDPCRSILMFFYYEKLSMDKISERLGYTNADNAKTQKYKCLNRLKSMMVITIKKSV